MNKLNIIFFLLFSYSLHAQTIQIQQLDESFDASELADPSEKNVNIKSLKNLKQEPSRELPSHEEVVQVFSKLDLSDETSLFDTFGKDQLYLRAGYFNLEELSSHYPKIAKKKLKKLIDHITDLKKEKSK